jgi:hypothetical protein
MAAPRPDAEQRLPESEALTRELDELDTALAELKAHYEQYFLGVERQPPNKADADVRQRLAKLRTGYVRSAVLKFRIQALQQRFTTYERLWHRTLTEMENGTYRRDLFKARRRRKTGETPAAETKSKVEAKAPSPVQETKAAVAAATPTPTPIPVETPPVPKTAPPPLPVATQGGTVRPSPVPSVAPIAIPKGTQGGVAPPGIPKGTQGAVARAAAEALAEPRLRKVYDDYVAAKKRCKEDVSRISYESVADSLRKQVPELLERHGARDVEYKVLVKDGKAVLRAVPKG